MISLRLYIGLFLLVACCGELLRGCTSDEFRQRGPLHLRVYIGTSRMDLRSAFVQALNFWSTVLEMDWRNTDQKNCDMELVDQPESAFASWVAALAYRSTGQIAFNPAFKHSAAQNYSISVHEIGHLLGLRDRVPESAINNRSFMRGGNNVGNETLDTQDLSALAKLHRLR